MRLLLILLTATLLALPAMAEWTVTSENNLTLTQYAYSDNWEGSEAGALSWSAASNTVAESQLSEIINNRNTLKLEFGQTHNQDGETHDWAKPVNSTDKIDFESVWRLTLGSFVDPFVSGRFEAQFTDERDPDETRYINPVVLTESAGVARMLIDEEPRIWSMRLGAALRQRLDGGVPTGEEGGFKSETTVDSGLEFVSEFTTPLAEDRLTFASKLTAYQALYNSRSDDVEGDDWKSPDVEWENRLTAGITDFLMVNLNLDAYYDKEIDDDPRLKQTLSLGFTWSI